MKRLALILFLAIPVQAATWYVASNGSDSNAGTSLVAPVQSLSHALSLMGCGDTLNVVANGSYVVGDAALPAFTNCQSVNTIQSTKLAMFNPPGFRTNPVADSNNYGKIRFVNQGIIIDFEANGSVGGATFIVYPSAFGSLVCTLSGITGVSSNTISYVCPNGNSLRLANGRSVVMEINSQGQGTQTNIFDGALNNMQKYYITNCSACDTPTGTFSLSATPGGSALTGLTCTAPDCFLHDGLGGQTFFELPLQVTAGTSTIYAPLAPSTWIVGTAINFFATGSQIYGTLPSPLLANTPYFITSISGSSFTVSNVLGGSNIVISDVGFGPLLASNANVAQNWAFRGLEFVDSNNGSSIHGMINLGQNFEVDRCYLHDAPGDLSPPHSLLNDNGTYVNIHDSWAIGAADGESQAVVGAQAPGPSMLSNNFLEAAGEVTIYGGNMGASGLANAYHTFTNNTFYKPPIWKTTRDLTAAPTGNCWWDNTDPTHVGGEWALYGSQWYQCNSTHTWNVSASSPSACGGPTYVCGQPELKDMTEHKNGRYFTYTGNFYNFSPTGFQSGEAFNNSNEIGSGPGWSDDHIYITNNKLFHIYEEMVRVSQCADSLISPCPYPVTNHVNFNNLMALDPQACGVSNQADGCGYIGGHVVQFDAGKAVVGDIHMHNTVFAPDTGFVSTPYASEGGGSTDCIHLTLAETYANSVDNLWLGDYTGQCLPGHLALLYYTSSTFSNNVYKAATSNYTSGIGATNIWQNTDQPADNTTIGFVNANGEPWGDYHLASTSPYSASSGTLVSHDGTDIGADIDLVNMMTSGSTSGFPNWDQQAALQFLPGSSKAIVNYNAPSSSACALTLYRAPARVASNAVLTVLDSSSTATQNNTERHLYVAPLTASTSYYYKLDCGSGVIMVGSFKTYAAGTQNQYFTFDWNSPTSMQYSLSPSMTSPTVLAAATRQTIPVPSNTVVYTQVIGGEKKILIAP